MYPQKLQTPLKFRWSKGRDMLWGIPYNPKTVQLNNNLYMGGGYIPRTSTSMSEMCTIQVYNNSGWSKLPGYQYCLFGMAVVSDHLTLVGGVDRDTDKFTNKLGVWDPSSQQWMHPYPPMLTCRRRPEAATYNNYLLAAGGCDGDGELTTVEFLDVRASEQWLSVTQLTIPCFKMTSAILHDNWYIITSSKQVMYTSLPELCTTKTPAQWQHLPDTPLEATTTIAVSDSLLTVGGRHDNTASTAIHLYHPETNTWTEVGDLPSPRCYCSVTQLCNREILIAGGCKEKDKKTVCIDIAIID